MGATHFGCSCALLHSHLCLEVDMLHLPPPLHLFPLHPFTLPHPGILLLPVRRLSCGQAQRLKDFPLAAALLLSLCPQPSSVPCPALPSLLGPFAPCLHPLRPSPSSRSSPSLISLRFANICIRGTSRPFFFKLFFYFCLCLCASFILLLLLCICFWGARPSECKCEIS